MTKDLAGVFAILTTVLLMAILNQRVVHNAALRVLAKLLPLAILLDPAELVLVEKNNCDMREKCLK